MLTSFLSWGLLNWVQNWRHLPVPVFYYTAYSFQRKFLCLCVSVPDLLRGIDPLSTRWQLALTSILGVRTVFRHIEYRQEGTRDAMKILPKITSGGSRTLVFQDLKTKCAIREMGKWSPSFISQPICAGNERWI